jgi:hypothetical protein
MFCPDDQTTRGLFWQCDFRECQPTGVQTEGATLVVRKKEDQDVFEKWRGRGALPGAANVDEYLGVIRDGDRR